MDYSHNSRDKYTIDSEVLDNYPCVLLQCDARGYVKEGFSIFTSICFYRLHRTISTMMTTAQQNTALSYLLHYAFDQDEVGIATMRLMNL